MGYPCEPDGTVYAAPEIAGAAASLSHPVSGPGPPHPRSITENKDFCKKKPEGIGYEKRLPGRGVPRTRGGSLLFPCRFFAMTAGYGVFVDISRIFDFPYPAAMNRSGGGHKHPFIAFTGTETCSLSGHARACATIASHVRISSWAAAASVFSAVFPLSVQPLNPPPALNG